MDSVHTISPGLRYLCYVEIVELRERERAISWFAAQSRPNVQNRSSLEQGRPASDHDDDRGNQDFDGIDDNKDDSDDDVTSISPNRSVRKQG